MAISWTITKNTATNVVRFEATGNIPLDLTQVQENDYVNIFGLGFNFNNRGSFKITNVEIFYVISTLHQAFEFVNPVGISETGTQNYNTDLQFFRPTLNNIQSENRTAVVSSTEDGKLEIVIPATTQAVNRTVKTGSYLHSNALIDITRVHRDKNGLVSVFYNSTPTPSLNANDFVYIDDVSFAPFSTYKSPGTPGVTPANGTTDACGVDCVSILQEHTSEPGRKNFAILKASDGKGVIVGGHTLVASTPTAANTVSRFTSVSQAAISDATLADGAIRYTYQLPTLGTYTNGTNAPTAANIIGGPSIGQIMMAGGSSIALANWSNVDITFGSTYKYDTSTNITTVSGTAPVPWLGNTLTTLSDGRIVAYGGASPASTFLSGANSNAGYIWNQATETWSVSSDFTTLAKRAHHTTTELPDGKLLFVGGLAGATAHPVDSNTLALWRLDETSGTTVNDSSGNTYTLTTSGTTAAVPGAKLHYGREFTQTAYADGPGNAGAVTALLGEWTVEWWSCGATGTYPGSMVLSGLGSGTIVAYGEASEVSADNTLMHVSISGGNLVWRWENGAGVDVTGSAAITGALTDHFNHFAVRKKYNGVNYDVTMFVNGKLIGTNLSQTNASDGSTAKWFIAKDPDGSAGFTGIIDDIKVSNMARSDQEILLDFFNGSSSIQTPVRNNRIGPLESRCETWDPVSTTVASVGSLSLARAYHTSTLLPDGRVVVIGGLAYNPTNFVSALVSSAGNSLYGPSASTGSVEIYNNVSQRWEIGPVAGIRRHKHSAIYIASRNCIFVVGGESTQGDDVKFIEILDLNIMKFSLMTEKLQYNTEGAVLLNNGTIFCGTSEIDGAGGYRKKNQSISLESQRKTSNSLNGLYKITNTSSGYFQFNTPDFKNYSSTYGKPKGATATYTVTTGSRTSNVTTLTFSASGHTFNVDDYVYVNLNYNPSAFASGLKVITSVGSNTISYAETASDQAPIAVTGEVYKNYSTESVFASVKAVSDSIPGPYIFDPVEGVSITSTRTTTTSVLSKNRQYTTLPVTDANIFPDEEGFIVIGYGTNIQTKPIKYFGRYNSTNLILDYGYVFTSEVPIGSDVTLLLERASFNPTTLNGHLYLTSSVAGRIAAQNTINDITAAGIDVNVKVIYPGDRGLGGEGLPSEGDTKLSDKIYIWGDDNG